MVSSRRVESSGTTSGTWTSGSPRQHVRVEAHVPGLAPVVELLAQPGRDLLVDPVGVDRGVVAPVDGEDQPELARSASTAARCSGYCSLQARSRPSWQRRPGAPGPARRRPRPRASKAAKLLLPVRAELGRHAAADERPAHRRGVGLQLGQFGRVLGRQGVGDGGEHLGHLHQRPLEPAQRLPQLRARARRDRGPAEQRAPAMRAAWPPTAPPTCA